MSDVTTTLADWIPQVQGRYLNEDWSPSNQGFGAQCWDVPANWAKRLGLPVISTGGKGRWPGWAGNMVDAFPQSAEIAAAYELLPPNTTAQGGDILVWGDGNPAVYPKTHVAVAVRDLGAQLLTVSQNSSASLPGNPYPQWTTGPTILQHLPRRGLIGIIRPRLDTITNQGTITFTEDDMPLTKADVDNIAARVAEVIQPIEDVTRQYLADRTRDGVLAVLNGTQAQADVTRDYVTTTTQAQADVTRQFLADRIKEVPAADFAAAVPDELLQGFVDAFAARLAE